MRKKGNRNQQPQGIQCYECHELGHIAYEYPNKKKKKRVVVLVTKEESSESEDSDEFDS